MFTIVITGYPYLGTSYDEVESVRLFSAIQNVLGLVGHFLGALRNGSDRDAGTADGIEAVAHAQRHKSPLEKDDGREQAGPATAEIANARGRPA